MPAEVKQFSKKRTAYGDSCDEPKKKKSCSAKFTGSVSPSPASHHLSVKSKYFKSTKNKGGKDVARRIKVAQEEDTYSHDLNLDLKILESVQNIVFYDYDNWSNNLPALLNDLPENTFVWIFVGGNTAWKEPV